MARHDVWLQLGEEFGGTPFGPLGSGEVRIGTAADTHVRVAPGLGVDPVHARVISEGQDAWLLAPVERSAEIWLLRAGQRDPTLLRAPVTVRTGDAFMLGSPHGVRFHLVSRQGPRDRRAAAANAEPTSTVSMYKTALAGEVLRRMRSAVLTTWLGRMVQNGWLFIRTGQMFSPVYIIGVLGMLSTGAFGAFNFKKARDLQLTVQEKSAALESCEGSGVNARSQQLSSITDGELIAIALGQPAWERSLEWREMKDALDAELHDLLARDHVADKGWTGSTSDYQTALRVLQGAGFPPDAAQILAWVAVEPTIATRPRALDAENNPVDTPWLMPSGAGTYQSCASGLFRLTFRQADALGLSASEDAWIDERSFPDATDRVTAIERQLLITHHSADPSAVAQTGEDYGQARFADAGTCVYRTGVEEQRADAGAVARRIAAKLGPSSSAVPALNETNGLSGRIALFYATDARLRAFANLSVDARSLRGAFDAMSAADSEGASLIAQRTGRAIARAIALPCRVTLQVSTAPDLPYKPPLEACAILRERARLGR
jgi:hypothetical protein